MGRFTHRFLPTFFEIRPLGPKLASHASPCQVFRSQVFTNQATLASQGFETDVIASDAARAEQQEEGVP
jgi:hypothetical protein